MPVIRLCEANGEVLVDLRDALLGTRIQPGAITSRYAHSICRLNRRICSHPFFTVSKAMLRFLNDGVGDQQA